MGELSDNERLCAKLAVVNAEVEKAKTENDDLLLSWKTSTHESTRQKMVAQNLFKNCQHQARTELQKGSEVAQQRCELEDVMSQMVAVQRQLSFAVELQTKAVADNEKKIACRARRIRKLEQALYQIVYKAQEEPQLRRVVEALITKCGPVAVNVLSREAQRQALEH